MEELKNIKELNIKASNRRMLVLIPGFTPLLCLLILFTVIGEGDLFWSEPYFRLLILVMIIVPIIIFLQAHMWLDRTIMEMAPWERQRVNEDCVTGYRLGGAILCRDCILFFGQRLMAVPYRDLLWVYQKGSSLYMMNRRRMPWTVSLRFKLPKGGTPIDTEGFFTVLQQFSPWTFYGYDPAIKKLYRQNFNQLIYQVDTRRMQILNGMQTPYGQPMPPMQQMQYGQSMPPMQQMPPMQSGQQIPPTAPAQNDLYPPQ